LAAGEVPRQVRYREGSRKGEALGIADVRPSFRNPQKIPALRLTKK